MKAPRCPAAVAARILILLTTTVLLVQCSMPPQQAWQSIQTKGLLTYLSSSRQSPPFGTGSAYSQRHASSQAYQRTSTPASSWYSNWIYGRPSRSYYSATKPSGYSPNSYFSSAASSSGSSRYVPHTRPRHSSGGSTPDVKIPVEEPAHTPQIANNPALVSPTTKTDVNAATPSADSLPYGSAVPGRMNMVNSPFAGKTQLVDVSGMSAGQTVKCPYTGKLFKVPPTQQATNQVTPRLESKTEPPKISDEPKDEAKKP